jgi:hypothetical protein
LIALDEARQRLLFDDQAARGSNHRLRNNGLGLLLIRLATLRHFLGRFFILVFILVAILWGANAFLGSTIPATISAAVASVASAAAIPAAIIVTEQTAQPGEQTATAATAVTTVARGGFGATAALVTMEEMAALTAFATTGIGTAGSARSGGRSRATGSGGRSRATRVTTAAIFMEQAFQSSEEPPAATPTVTAIAPATARIVRDNGRSGDRLDSSGSRVSARKQGRRYQQESSIHD